MRRKDLRGFGTVIDSQDKWKNILIKHIIKHAEQKDYDDGEKYINFLGEKQRDRSYVLS